MTLPDFRVARRSIADLDDGSYFWALVEPTWPSSEVPDERTHLLAATRGQRILYSTMLLTRDVSNGGLWQAFWNFALWFMALAENSYWRLGASEQSRALLQARDLLDRHAMAGTLEVRRNYLGRHKAALLSAFDSLDPAFYDEERSYPLYHAYIAAHPEEFFLP